MTSIRAINPPELFVPTSAYSQGMAAGDWVFVGGQVSFDSNMEVVGVDDLGSQTRQTLANVEAVLRAAGAGLQDVVATTVYLRSFEDYREYDAVYRECFGDHLPARATVRAELVLPALLVEIQAIAVKRSS